MTLREWIETQDTRDTVELLRRANARPVESSTPQPNQDVPREQWDVQRRKVLRYVMTQAGIVFADLQNAATIRNKIGLWIRGLATVNDKTDMLSTYVPVFWTAYVEYRSRDISGENDETESVPQPDMVVFGDSPATANGFTADTGTDIEEAQR